MTASHGPGEEEIVPPEAASEDALGEVPGQVVVRIDRGGGEGGGAGVAEAADTGFMDSLPVFGDTAAAAAGIESRTGNADLDSALDAVGATALWRVQGPGGQGGVADVEEGLPELSDLILVDFDPKHSTDEAIRTLRRASVVADVTPSGGFSIAMIPNDPQFPSQWGLTDVGCPAAWDTTLGDPGVVVGVLDTGCDLTHRDLSTQFANPGTNVLVTGGSAQDDHGHGTHVAGIIAALGNNGVDVAGVGWRTKLVPVKILNSAGQAVGASIAQGIAWAAPRCSIISLSVQGAVDDATLRAAMDGAQRLGVLVVVAMGNFGWGEAQPSFPAAYAQTHNNVIAVGAVDQQHHRSVWSSTQSSNTGSWIGLAAPGTNIYSTGNGGGVRIMSGTSQACPFVTGAASLIRAVAPALTAQQLLAILKRTARPLRDNPTDPVPNPSYGSGLLDVNAAVASALAIGGVVAVGAGGGGGQTGGGQTAGQTPATPVVSGPGDTTREVPAVASTTGALISVWDGIIPGREAQSLDVFVRLQGYWQRHKDAGRISGRRAFLSTTPGDSGFEIVEGDFDELAGMLNDDGHRDISILARSVMERLRTHLCINALGGGGGAGAAAAGEGAFFGPWAEVNPQAAAAVAAGAASAAKTSTPATYAKRPGAT